MTLEEIREAIKRNQEVYPPSPLSVDDIDFKQGTRITLKGLKKRQTINTSEALRTRLARRFSVIGPTHGFEVSVNDRVISPSDRGYYDKLQYVWTYGDFSSLESYCTNLENSEPRSTDIGQPPMSVTGWLGTVRESGQLKDAYGENLNRIAIFRQRKKPRRKIFWQIFPNEVSMQVT